MSLFACSGSNALAVIARNIESATFEAEWVAAVFSLSMVVYLYAGRRTWPFPCAIAAMLIVHPLWAINPYLGDCGIALANAAAFITGIAIVTFVTQLGWLTWNHRRASNRRNSALPG